MYPKKRIEELREVSGTVTSEDKVVSLLYELMRDHIPPGVMEKLVIETATAPKTVIFTNGWLAQYSKDLADKLK